MSAVCEDLYRFRYAMNCISIRAATGVQSASSVVLWETAFSFRFFFLTQHLRCCVLIISRSNEKFFSHCPLSSMTLHCATGFMYSQLLHFPSVLNVLVYLLRYHPHQSTFVRDTIMLVVVWNLCVLPSVPR